MTPEAIAMLTFAAALVYGIGVFFNIQKLN